MAARCWLRDGFEIGTNMGESGDEAEPDSAARWPGSSAVDNGFKLVFHIGKETNPWVPILHVKQR